MSKKKKWGDFLKKKLFGGKVSLWSLCVVAAAVVIIVTALAATLPGVTEARIVSTSVLQEIVNVSELSTFEAVYNGVTQVYKEGEEQTKDNIAYHVSYKGRVKLGFDFEKIKVDVNVGEKVITVTYPGVNITNVIVDITTLDYIFLDKKYNTIGVSAVAYAACIEDVKNESQTQEAIYALAEQSAKNCIRALVEPFVKQLDGDYTLIIEKEGQA